MSGFKNREQLRRWIAEAGMVCIGAGALWTGGCAGAARDGIAAGGSTPAKSGSQIASTEKVGRASLSDRRPATAKRPPERQTAARTRRPRGTAPAGDPFLADAPAVAQRKPRPPQSPAVRASRTEIAATPSTPGTARIVARRPAVPQAPTLTASPRTAPAQPTLPQTAAAAPRASQRIIAQASARIPADVRRPKLSEISRPVITPAAPAASEADTATTTPGYERQRADRLMERAHLMLSHNFREEALRLAAVAEQLEKSRQAIYLPGEERPSALVAQLQLAASDGSGVSKSSSDSSRQEGAPRAARKNRSQPTLPLQPGIRRGHVELIDIRAGWQAAAESEETAVASFDGATRERSSDNADRSQVALLDTPETQASRSTAELATSAGALASTDASTAGEAETTGVEVSRVNGDDIADVEPIADPNPSAARSPVNATTMGGLLAGLAGLMGLAYWRRQERKHYAGTAR